LGFRYPVKIEGAIFPVLSGPSLFFPSRNPFSSFLIGWSFPFSGLFFFAAWAALIGVFASTFCTTELSLLLFPLLCPFLRSKKPRSPSVSFCRGPSSFKTSGLSCLFSPVFPPPLFALASQGRLAPVFFSFFVELAGFFFRTGGVPPLWVDSFFFTALVRFPS